MQLVKPYKCTVKVKVKVGFCGVSVTGTCTNVNPVNHYLNYYTPLTPATPFHMAVITTKLASFPGPTRKSGK